jgi:microcystin degradation protein MlrC
MRIGIARISSETTTFSPKLTDIQTIRAFGVVRGHKVLEASDWSEYIAGYLDVVGDQELLGITHVHALPAGYLTEDALYAILGWFTEDLKGALPLDEEMTWHSARAPVFRSRPQT